VISYQLVGRIGIRHVSIYSRFPEVYENVEFLEFYPCNQIKMQLREFLKLPAVDDETIREL